MNKFPRRLSRRVAASIVLVIAVAAIVGIVLAVQSPSVTRASSGGNSASGATTVQRRDLVETDTESGTLSYANPQTVYNRLSGTLTWLPSVGQVIRPGQALYKVSGQSVILMNGSTPAYRDLSAADSDGPDILELNRNLVALGFTSEGIIEDDVWQPATTAAVEVFQESIGEAPTGVLTLGQVVFLPGDQVVSAVDSTLGSTGGGGSGSAASYTVPGSSTEFVSLTGPTTGPSTNSPENSRKAGKSQNAKTLAALIALLKAESAQLKAETAELRAAQGSGHGASGSGSSGHGSSGSGASGHGSSGHGSSGSGGSGSGSSGGGSSGGGSSGGGGSGGGGGGSATAILQTSSNRLIVTVDLDASKQSEAKVGEKVTVEMPNGSTVNGTVTAVSSVAQTSSGSGGGNGGGGNSGSGSGNGGGNGNGSSSPTIPVTIALSGHISGAGLDQAAVSVNLAQAKANNVLSVPVTALLATAGGGYAVQAAAAPHKLIPVTTGLFAAGDVQISGPGIYPGLEVTDSQG